MKLKEKQLIINNIESNYVINTKGKIFHIFKNGNKTEVKSRYDKDGYKTITLYVNKKPYSFRIARLVGISFLKIPKRLKMYNINELQINHKDGNHDNDYYKNLEWTTCKENIHHAWKTGLSKAKSCEKHPNSVYKNKTIEKVCKLLSKGKYTYFEISEMTNVSYTVVKQIKNRCLWRNISSKYNFPKAIKRPRKKINKI